MNKEIIKGSDEVYEQIVLLDHFRKLGPNARRVLLALAERLVVGIPHGDFDKPHDWDKESSEEALDLAVYQAAKLLGLGQETGKGGPKLQTAREYTAPDGVRVSLDGRTSDGMPWVPPTGARVRVVHMWKESAFLRKGGNMTQTFVVTSAEAHDDDEAAIDFEGFVRFGYLLRVVPA